jgi:hypothetical protein
MREVGSTRVQVASSQIEVGKLLEWLTSQDSVLFAFGCHIVPLSSIIASND